MRHQGARSLSRAQSRSGCPLWQAELPHILLSFCWCGSGRTTAYATSRKDGVPVSRSPRYPTHTPASTTTSTFTAKSASSKLYLHKPIVDDLFHCGCLLGGIHSGVKHSRPRHLPLSTPSRSTSATATFTRNAFKAAPVTASKICSPSNRARALALNNGCHNAVTGHQGARASEA